MSDHNVPASPRSIRLLCFVTAAVVLAEVATYPAVADFLGRRLWRREEGLGPAALAVQLLRILPAGVVFVVLSTVAIALVGQARRELLWPLMVGIALINLGLLVASVSNDFKELDKARRRGRAATTSGVYHGGVLPDLASAFVEENPAVPNC